MKGAISFVILLTLASVTFSQNLVVNPGFETWSTTTKPTDWTNRQSCLKDSDFVKTEIYSCRQDGGTSSRDLGQRISVSPGKQYRFSLFYKSGIATTGNGCRVWCEWLDDNKDPIDDPSSESILHSGFLRSDTWKQFSADITSPAGAGYFYLLIRTLPNSTTYWDDFSFEETIPTFDNLMNESLLQIYPNPTSNYLTINDLNQIQRIDIYELSGSVIWSDNFSGENNITIPVSDFPNGLYFIKITYENKSIIKKFIKKAN
jgi:Secretion system C-terminal sorting domain